MQAFPSPRSPRPSQGTSPRAMNPATVELSSLTLDQQLFQGKERLVKAYNELAITLFRQGQTEQAIQQFQKILDLATELPTIEVAKVYYNMAMGLEQQGQTDETREYLQKAIALNPSFKPALLELAKKDFKYQISLKGYQFVQDWFSRNLLIWQEHLQSFVGQPGLHFLEIGCWEGMASCWLLENVLTHTSARLTCIDTFAGSIEQQAEFDHRYIQSIEAQFDLNISKTGAAAKVKKLVGKSQELMRSLPLNTYDFIYIDGSHLAADVLADAVLGWGLLKLNGILIFDDYDFDRHHATQYTHLAIDSFLNCFAERLTLLEQSHQVILQKIHE